jgi:hypothetical protein
MQNNPNRGFVFKTVSTDAGQRSVARFICSSCGDILDIANIGSKSPTFFVARAVRHGWAAHESKANRCYCPRCLASSPAQAREVKPVSIPTTTVGPRSPTTDERLKIRALLDKHFDDAIGEYLDGMNDEKIAAAVNVPRVLVSGIRDAAYGPVRVNPELREIQNRLNNLQTELDDLRGKLTGLLKAA